MKLKEKGRENKITMKKLKKQVKGITLIALVVTIIVLLILAGVAINLTVGDNGLFRRAQNAADTWQETSEREAIELAVAGMQIGTTQGNGMTKTELENSLKDQFGDEASVEENEDGSFLVTIGENQYYVGEDGEIIDNSNMLEISTAEELKAFRDDVNSGNTYEGKYVYLTNDITLDSGEEWEPIGVITDDTDLNNMDNQSNKAFKGIFDGCNKTISNLKTNTTANYQGLFGFAVDGKIRNVIIGESSSVVAGNESGAIVGFLSGLGNVYNCVNYANVNGSSGIGGIIGYIRGQSIISNCKNYGSIYSQNNAAGGILGSGDSINAGNNIMNCGNYGIVSSAKDYCGGIVGYFNGSIMNCCNKGEVRGTNNYTGGIVGNKEPKYPIENCYNIANVSGQIYVGGILGASNMSTGVATIKNCYSIGEITGTQSVGDITGVLDFGGAEDINCYTKNSGEFTAQDLGDAFKGDIENVNKGYPMLKWE